MHKCVFAPASPTAIVKAAVARSNVNVYAVVGAGMSVCDGVKKGSHMNTGSFAQSHSTTSRLYGRQKWGGPGACYLYRPMNVQFFYHKANTMTGPVASGGDNSEEHATFFGATYDFGAGNAHVVYADKKLQTINGDGKDRNGLAGAAGKVLAAETCNQVRDMASGYFDRNAIGYTYLLPICTNLYTLHGANVKRFNVGMRHMF